MIRLDQAFAGKRILVTGATGFLGKVFVSKLLHDAPSVGRVTALIRKGRAASAAARMEEEIVRSPALSPLAPGALAKLEALEGDTGIARFGLGEPGFAALAARIDVVVHCAGVVDFSPPLDEAISVNVDGTIEAIALAKAARAPLVHISTCYVSGAIEGRVEEGCEKGDHPDRSRTGFAGYDAEREVEICRALVERIKREQDDPSIMAEHLREKGGDLAAARRAAQDRARARQREEGKDRARRWGFPNSYTYSKSLAEQLVVKARDAGLVRACVVRPAILESASRYPFPGWNQGANTTAPLVYMTYRGHRFLPLKEGNFLDVLPIDMCAGAMVAITAAHIEGRAEKCYQLGSGDTNRLDLYRSMELTALYYRRRPIPGWNPLISLTARRFLETTGVSERLYRATSLPFFAGAAKLVSKTLAKIDGGEKKLASALLPLPEGAPADDPVVRERRRGLARALKNVRRTVGDAEKMLRKTATVIDEYLPFIHGARPIYSTRNARALRDALSVEDRDRMYFEPESIDWRRYWHEVHLPGMEKWTFPELDRLASRAAKKDARGGKQRAAVASGPEEAAPFPHHASSQAMAAIAAVTKDEASETRRFVKPEAAAPVPDTTTEPISGGRAPARPATLLDVLEGAVKRDGSHAMLEGLSGREVHARALAGATRLRARGVAPGDRVALVGEGSPAWVIGYFAILAAGGTAVPLDATLSAKDVAHLGKLARAKGIYASEKRRLAFAGAVATEPSAGGVGEGFPLPGLESLEDLAASPEAGRTLEPAHQPRDPEAPASLIFTSGTTGAPKGVLLPHRAFCSQVAALSQLYVLGPDDRVLSVLPAHHAFEFTCGLMLPIFSGATVCFAGASTPEAVRAALRRVRPTAMIAVPALLEAFLRSIRREVKARGELAAKALEAAIASHRRMRDATGKNLGKTLFRPAHDAFGGDLRLLVSGGASLAASAFEAFRGLGFDIYEGYGLTEAGPVVATCRPGRTPRAGQVGLPIPGAEVRLARLRPDGAGEIEVRGPGLTLGYDENPAATALLLGADGWLRTGDLGKADEDGCLSIVGRVKDVIVDASGNTVYPDEVEEAYAGVEGVAELAVARVATEDGREVVGALVLAKDGAPEESIRQGFRSVDASLPFPKRVKVLRFASAALPRTATRKVKREEISRALASILERERTGHAAAARIEARAEGPDGAETAARLKARRMVAELAGKDPASIPADARLGEDLGLDSLAQVDLAAAIAEETGRALPKDRPLEGVATVADVARLLESSANRGIDAVRPERSAPEGRAESKGPRAPRGGETPRLPGILQTAGNSLLSFLQYSLYDGPMRSEVTGRGNIPQHTNALVVSNHASHLDVGLVKHALGEYGRHAASLGARDYFFSTPLRRLYFENFTEVVPFDRQDTSREKLDEVVGRLASGESVIIFPEGTRAVDGRLGQFRSGLGYLVLKSRKGVLPVWLEGTHRALPKGAQMLRSRDLGARIGRYLPYEELAAVAAGLGRREAYRAIGAYVRAAIERLRDGASDLPEAHRGAGWRATQATAALPHEPQGDAGELDAPGEIDAGDSAIIPVPALAAPPAAKAASVTTEIRVAPETPEARAARLLRSLPARHKQGRITQSKSFYVKFGEGHDDRYTIALTPERCTVTPGKGLAPADCVVRSTPEVLERLIVEGSAPSFEDIAVGAFKTNDPDALTLLVEALGLGENAVR